MKSWSCCPADVPLVFEETDLRRVVNDVLQELGEAAGGRIVLSAPGDAAIVGRWDPRGLREAVRRVVSNAVKFGGGKPIQIDLSAEPEAASLSVRDQGIGIVVEEQEHIFDRFGRAVPVKNFGGFGLGLWIARTIVEAHGGTLTVSSQPGAGATFTMRLPLT